MVLLIGNYPLDEQQSMDRFAAMMLTGLTSMGVNAEILLPAVHVGRLRRGGFVGKWLGYFDKFILFPFTVRRAARRASVVHICDHSNAMYAKQVRRAPTVVTCHDLLAVRGGLGEQTDCPASPAGKLLQRWILSGLRNAAAIGCDSRATLADARRLIGDRTKLELIRLGLSFEYKPIVDQEVNHCLTSFVPELIDQDFVLHVGSNLRRKNREGVLHIVARCADRWNGRLVFAGDPLSDSLRVLARKLGIDARIIEVPRPTNERLEALYNRAIALIYPSRFEGFGWPILEAQACGCPVVCTNTDPMAEVAGDAGLLRSVDDEAGFAADILRLTNPAERAIWSAKSLQNAARFSTAAMIEKYRELYCSLGVTC